MENKNEVTNQSQDMAKESVPFHLKPLSGFNPNLC